MAEAGDEGALVQPLPAGWDDSVDIEADPAVVPDPAEVDVPPELRERIENLMARYPDRHSAALPALSAAQKVHGWCSPLAMRQVAAVMQVTPAYLSSVATFYDMLRTDPIGSRYVYVCTSVSCHLSDAKAVHDAIWEEARDQGLEDVEIREFECLGACDMAPMASIDGRYVGPLSEDDAPEIVSALKENREVLPGRSLEDQGYRLPWER
jgi:NADH:ubiquinone oxidoreductase subunit E